MRSRTIGPASSKDKKLALKNLLDPAFKKTQEGARKLDLNWARLGRLWHPLTTEAVKTGWFGLGAPIVSPNWMTYLLFMDTVSWPLGLTTKEKDLLEMAEIVSRYYLTDEGFVKNPLTEESEALSLRALKSYARLFEAKVAKPLWKSYWSVAKTTGQAISPLCQDLYGSPCPLKEAMGIFHGDFRRGWQTDTLDLSPTGYALYGKLRDYISNGDLI